MNAKALHYVLFCLLLTTLSMAGTVTLSTDLELPATNPDPNEDITFFVQSDGPIFFMNLTIRIFGDVTITDVMDETDCDLYGWSTDLTPISYIGENTIQFSAMQWGSNYNETIGYFKLRYNRGKVAIWITDDSFTFDWGTLVDYDTTPITFGELSLPPLKPSPDPQSVLIQAPPSEPVPEPEDLFPDITTSMDIEPLDLDLELPIVQISEDITENQVWHKDNIYWLSTGQISVRALLVIEPGTTVIFCYQAGLFVEDGGTLIADGTPDEPIVFTPDVMYFSFPSYIGFYWNFLVEHGPYYWSPAYITETASPACSVTNCMIEGAFGGVVTENIRLDNPIENNWISGNYYGIYENGPKTTDICNNLCYFNYDSGIEVYLQPDPNEAPNIDYPLTIEQNTCDFFQYNGISVHGVNTADLVPQVRLYNNIVTSSYWYGLNMSDGYIQIVAVNTGYANNDDNKNWDFFEYNPIVTTTSPYSKYMGDDNWEHHYLTPNSPFVDVGDEVSYSKFIGMTTDVNSLPDTGLLDLGFHVTNWDYATVDGKKVGTDFDDVLQLATYWLQYDPSDPNGPSYIDPNLVSDPNTLPDLLQFEGDWNHDRHVDYADFAIVAGMWQNIAKDPNIIPVISGDPSEGSVMVTATGYTRDIDRIYVLLNGVRVGQAYAFKQDMPVWIDLTGLGNIPQQIKLVAADYDDHLIFSKTKTIQSDPRPLQYCILPKCYDPNEPIPFVAYQPEDSNATVKVYGNGAQLLWQDSFAGNTINGYIPAIGDGNYIDYVVFDAGQSASASSYNTIQSVPPWCKVIVEEVKWGEIDKEKQAMMIMPDNKINVLDPQVICEVYKAFQDKGIGVVRLGGSLATWEKIARYGQYGHIKYIYILSHGDYKIANKDETVLRTSTELYDGTWIVSCKASEFDGTPPAWCKPLPEPLESKVKTWASADFRELEFVHNSSCYSGRLEFNDSGDLIEGEPGDFAQITTSPYSDITMALQLHYKNSDRAYHGWWQKGWVGWYFSNTPESTYVDWEVDLWRKLGQSQTLRTAIEYAIDETHDFGDITAVKNYRIRGTDDPFKIYLSTH